jgi:hypothetical protein
MRIAAIYTYFFSSLPTDISQRFIYHGDFEIWLNELPPRQSRCVVIARRSKMKRAHGIGQPRCSHARQMTSERLEQPGRHTGEQVAQDSRAQAADAAA